MNAEDQMGPGMIRVMEKIQKLLNLAAKNSNAEEAAAAAAKAQELLAQYNLDAATVERQTGGSGGADGRREEAQTRGGFYHWQRELWTAVARLNFCLYWTQSYWEEGRFRARRTERELVCASEDIKKTKITEGRAQRRHRVVGRLVNTRSTVAMAGYLEQAIERLAREHIKGDLRQLYSREANSFRYGAMEVVVEKLNARYHKMERDEAARRREAERRAEAAGASVATALTLADVRQSEQDANYDHVYGEGWSARRRERQAQAARAAAKAEAEYARWAEANPEEARVEEEKRMQEARRRERDDTHYVKVDGGAYRRGREAARSISVDRQAAASAPAGAIEGGRG